jgi:DinB superfamily
MTSTVPSAVADALASTDAALGGLADVLAGLGDGALHLAHRDGGWTPAQLVSHINVSVLLWTALLSRVAHDPALSFVLREEVGHDAQGYPPPTVQVALQHLASARRTLATVVPAVPADVMSRELTIPDLGTLTVEVWTPPILGHAAGHAQQALDVLDDRGALA